MFVKRVRDEINSSLDVKILEGEREEMRIFKELYCVWGEIIFFRILRSEIIFSKNLRSFLVFFGVFYFC